MVEVDVGGWVDIVGRGHGADGGTQARSQSEACLLTRLLSNVYFRKVSTEPLPPESQPGPPRDLGADPLAMRALAHPVRIRLLEELTFRGPLTATQAAHYIGESPSSCSFHLRTLAKYGFV